MSAISSLASPDPTHLAREAAASWSKSTQSVRPLADESAASFDRMMAESDRREAISAAARGLVAQSLILPVLKELRGGSLAWGPFAPGDAEKRFGPMLDVALADRIAASPRMAATKAIEARLLARERGVA
ncbi:MAG: hypothetical protein KF724_04395 [Phycisphaeraceae bacterium]|nr:hypothetical protein [Phycisphaeraceae bacterium]